jgi:HEPN domain-containing protein
MKRTTREWVRKAEKDYTLAVLASQSAVPVHDGVCFHCQQCAEKYLKGLLEEHGHTIPKTHTLVLLLATLVTHHPELQAFRRGLIFLSPFAVETRYPGENANKRQAVSALRWAAKVRAKARQLLGLR